MEPKQPSESWQNYASRLQGELGQEAQETRKHLEAERDRLREALLGYHNLAPRLAEYLNDIGAALAYSDLHRANERAEAALEFHSLPKENDS